MKRNIRDSYECRCGRHKSCRGKRQWNLSKALKECECQCHRKAS